MKFNTFKILGYLQLFIGVSAIAGGIPMITTPDGSGQGMPLTVLAGSPFTNFLIPGILLVVVIGFLSLIGSYFSLKFKKQSGYIGMLLGNVLIIWIAVQIYMIGYGSLLQPFYLTAGIFELILGALTSRKSQ